MADETVRTARGPESEKSRLLRASEKFDSMSPGAKAMAKAALTAPDAAARSEAAAKDHKDVASFLGIVGPLDAGAVAKLVKLVS